jgi:hypothetical protein
LEERAASDISNETPATSKKTNPSLSEKTIARNAAILDWLRRKYRDDAVVQEIRGSAKKIDYPVDQLRVWIDKVAEVKSADERTDATCALAGRFKKITDKLLAELFDRSTGWVKECIRADKLMRTARKVPPERSEYGVRSYLAFLSTVQNNPDSDKE